MLVTFIVQPLASRTSIYGLVIQPKLFASNMLQKPRLMAFQLHLRMRLLVCRGAQIEVPIVELDVRKRASGT